MVVQNLHLMKLNGALHGKEKKEKDWSSNHSLIIDLSKGQVYSLEEILEGLYLADKKKKEAVQQKKLRADTRAAKKDAQARLEEEWGRIKEEHEKRLAEWQATCDNCQRNGIPKKEWPHKPTRPQKPTLPANFAAIGDDDNMGKEENEEEID
ncbi:hypothetical protein MD484_g5470, partial [Candolleomyces efflorescens]